MENPLIEVIIPVYNTEQYLRECLDSVFNQTYKNIHVICVNDGSTDNSLTILNEYKVKHKNLIIIDSENKGPSSARNLALKSLDFSKEFLIGFVDSDDLIETAYLQKLEETMRKDNSDIVCCSFSFYNSLKSKKCLLDGSVFNIYSKFEGTKLLIEDRTIQSHSHCKLYKSKCWENVFYPIDIVSMEDQGTIFKTFCKADKISVIDYYGYYYRQRESSTCSTTLDTNKGVIDSLMGYKIPTDYEYPELNENEKKILKDSATQSFANVYLMMYPRFNKKTANEYELNTFNSIVKFVKKNKAIAKFKPLNKKEKIKKGTYLFLRPFYRKLYLKYINK